MKRLERVWVSLHTGDPSGGDQTKSEISYTGYSRRAATIGWITFGEMTAGDGGTVTHFGVGSAAHGAGELLYRGSVIPDMSLTIGITPFCQACDRAY